MEELFSNNKSSNVTSSRILYTPSSFARSSLLHLQEIGEHTALRPHASFKSNLQSFLFFIVTSASGTLVYNEKTYKLEGGDCVFIDCRNPYSHTTDHHNLWTLKWIHFYGPNVPSIYDKYKERGGRPVFQPEDGEKIEDIYFMDASRNSQVNYAKYSENRRDSPQFSRFLPMQPPVKTSVLRS